MLIRTFLTLMMLASFSIGASDIPALKDPKQIVPIQVQQLDDLIVMTERTLTNLKNISAQLKEYQNIQERYLENTKDNELLYRMIKSAHKLLETIKADNLVHSFDPEFISELNLLSQISQKIGIPKP